MLSRTLLLTTLTSAILAALPVAAQDTSVSPAQGAAADKGQINRGGAPQVPSAAPSSPIPTREEIRAALMMPDPGTISVGEQPNASGKPQPETTGTGLTSGEQPGPIGSTMQTKPAKFSHRNDVIDHTPIMGMPLRLDEQHRNQIFQALMSDKTPAAEVQGLNPTDALPYSLTLKVNPLPDNLRNIPELSKLAYLKSKDKAYLVTTETASPVVVDILDGK